MLHPFAFPSAFSWRFMGLEVWPKRVDVFRGTAQKLKLILMGEVLRHARLAGGTLQLPPVASSAPDPAGWTVGGFEHRTPFPPTTHGPRCQIYQIYWIGLGLAAGLAESCGLGGDRGAGRMRRWGGHGIPSVHAWRRGHPKKNPPSASCCGY